MSVGRTYHFTEADLAQMELLYTSYGWTTRAIASLFGCTGSSVWARLKERHVEIRPRGFRVKPYRFVTGHGYVRTVGGYEHRLVAERMLGRPLRPGEVVHHINHNKTDNRPENLEVFSSHAEHMRHHNPKIWTVALQARLIELRLSGYSSTIIAQELGKSKISVKARIHFLVRRGIIPFLGRQHVTRYHRPIDLDEAVTVARLDNAGAIHDPQTCQHPDCRIPW
jgi:HNH endonuclease